MYLSAVCISFPFSWLFLRPVRCGGPLRDGTGIDPPLPPLPLTETTPECLPPVKASRNQAPTHLPSPPISSSNAKNEETKNNQMATTGLMDTTMNNHLEMSTPLTLKLNKRNARLQQLPISFHFQQSNRVRNNKIIS